jgi:hypothetical protein
MANTFLGIKAQLWSLNSPVHGYIDKTGSTIDVIVP